MRDHFIETNGLSATLRVPNVTQYNAYHEIDWDTSTWTDTSIKVLLGPQVKDRHRKSPEGLTETSEDLNITFKSTDSPAIGNLVIIGGITYRIIDLWTRPYQGLTVKKGIVRSE